MDGTLRCSKYAFGPNRLHYCGPDQNKEIFSYIEEEKSDRGLVALLSQFETMYPYLRHIAEANEIKNPLDDRVVEAYWLGNVLLEKIPKQKFYTHLLDSLHLKDKFGLKTFNFITNKLDTGALPHHSFHVLDIWKRGGYSDREHTVESMGECIVTWGKIVSVSGPFIIAETEPLIYKDKKLSLGPSVQKKFTRQLESDYDIEQLKQGDLVSIHWGVICEKITPEQFRNLKKYTLRHISLANETI